MKLIQGHICHIYNRGINSRPLFVYERNYEYFLQKIKKEIIPSADVLAYCLMPNHFHFLIRIKEINSDQNIDNNSLLQLSRSTTQPHGLRSRGTTPRPLSEGIRILLSSYTRAFNKQELQTGSLFQQNTKAKFISGDDSIVRCIHYIHSNPVKAGLVNTREAWDHSSYNEYTGRITGTICNIDLVCKLLNITDRESLVNHITGIHDETLTM